MYKVLNFKDNKLVSAVISTSCWADIQRKYTKHYSRYEWNHPIENTKLMVFDKLEEAVNFAQVEANFGDLTLLIFSCQVLNPKPVQYIGEIYDIENYWSKEQRYVKPAPKGTYLVDGLLLSDLVCTIIRSPGLNGIDEP